jgi:polysaccharide biosynthesis protein PslE
MKNSDQLLELYRFAQNAAQRNWRKGAAVFAAGALLAFVGALFMPRSYYSEARLFVRFGRENQVDPTAAGSPMVALYESRESEINSLIEILKSRAILDRAVARLGPDYILAGRSRGPEADFDAATPPSRAHQRAVTQLTKTVSVSAPRKSNIITVACKAKSPAAAQKIVAALVEVYQDEHVRVHRSPGSYAFFEQQAAQSLESWQKAADELRAMKNRLGIVTIEGGRKKLEDQIAEIDRRLLTDRAELSSVQGKIASLERQLDTVPAKIVTQANTGPSAAFDGMRQTLFNLEAQEQDLASKMQDNHPRLVAVRHAVADARAILSAQPNERLQTTEALNPSYQSLEQSLLVSRTRAAELAANERALAAQQRELDHELVELNAQAKNIDELQQRVALAETNHKEYAQRLEQARINRTLDDERMSSLSLVQPASYVATAVGPRRSLVLALGLFVAGMAGAATMLAFAWLNPLLMTAEQLAATIDIPLTAVVPRSTMRMAVGT